MICTAPVGDQEEDGPDPERFMQGWPYYRAKRYAELEAMAAADEALEIICLNPFCGKT